MVLLHKSSSRMKKVALLRYYRFLSKAARQLFGKDSHVLLGAMAEDLNLQIMKLSTGVQVQTEIHRPRTPQNALRVAFKEGVHADLDVLHSFLPQLLRYTRASRLIHQQQLTKAPHRLMKGAMLVSKLYYGEKALKEADLDRLHASWLAILRGMLEHPAGAEGSGGLSDRWGQHTIFNLMEALDKILRDGRGFSFQDRPEPRLALMVHWVLSNRAKAFSSATSEIFAALFTDLINGLGLGVRAYAVDYLTDFRLRLIVPVKPRPTESILRDAADDSSHAARVYVHPVPSTVSVQELVDTWMCCTPRGFFQVHLRYDTPDTPDTPDNSTDSADHRHGHKQLQAIRMHADGSEEMLWFLPIQSETLLLSVTHTIDLEAKYDVRFSGLPAQFFGSKAFGKAPRSGPHYEIEVTHHEGEQRERHYYCRVSEVDWCLWDISDYGVMPITSMKMRSSLKEDGYNVNKMAKKDLCPETSASVARKMATRLSDDAERSNRNNPMGGRNPTEAAFWNAVRKQLISMEDPAWATRAAKWKQTKR